MHMHQLPCPPSIIPEVWRRALILCLIGPGPASTLSEAFMPENIFQRLRKALNIQCTVVRYPEERFVLDIPCEMDNLKWLRESLLLLQAECQGILDLFAKRYDSKAVIDWHRRQKSEIPDHFNRQTKDEHIRDLDRKIAENERVRSIVAPYEQNFNAAQQALEDDKRKYQRWANKVARTERELWDRKIAALKASLQAAEASRAAIMV
ncbi:uncharacterized protein MYCFIDRAFT_212765 [Pseudocercospora fijiensis CIRAD86]|uniref:Uncharacterized protein n=1 Tax=Pseudocercospora fijiensis (strain CIRAD86) TaxID=383855 RepID=M2ZXL0_PSEFD|nr:uncharacterized protein MYCFIDRAFT_212765 [Pseudocercospora fijiensis CIRAD86]EME76826.1 hypothetical protein MYCFIDRAFT_212765 [Pseudocercospora fijiensis CIRAD86]